MTSSAPSYVTGPALSYTRVTSRYDPTLSYTRVTTPFIYRCDHILSYTDVVTLITHNIEDSRRSYTAVVIPCYAQHYNN